MFAQWVATLDQKTRDNPMKCRVIIKFQPDEIEEAFHMSGRVVRKKSDFYIPEFGRDNGFGIFLFEL